LKNLKKADSDSDSEDEGAKSDASEEVVHTNGNKAKPQESAGHNELFVRNLSYNTTEESLQAYFETYGTVTKVKILTNRDDGRSKGIGFVEFSSNEEAKAALDDAANLNCDGRY
jgi:nucleolin